MYLIHINKNLIKIKIYLKKTKTILILKKENHQLQEPSFGKELFFKE